MPAPDAVLSVGRAAAELGVSPSTVRNWIDKGYIRAVVFPSGHRRVPEEEVARLLAQMFDVTDSGEPEDPDASPARLGAPVDDSLEPAF